MNEQVLVIDDEKDAVDNIVLQLQMRDITCRGEIDPEEAIERFRANPTDVVIVDYVFPLTTGITGIDIIARLKEIKPFTQFILISGFIDKDLDEETLTEELKNKLKANRYIPKPIDLHNLVNIVREALQDIDSQSSSWKSMAGEYVSKGSVSAEQARDLNEKIKEHLVKAVDEDHEE